MNTRDALLAGIVTEPLEETRWLVLADWLEENDDPRRAELLRLHRRLLATCTDPDAHPERSAWQARVVSLLGGGVTPCVPRRAVVLPGGVPITWTFTPPGTFLRGSNGGAGPMFDDEQPVHAVTLTRGFYLGVHPVTQIQWEAVTGTNPSHFKGLHRPVETVSWDDCRVFCARLTDLTGFRARFPTEAEWEWACRAGTVTEYHAGDDKTALGSVGWYARNAKKKTTPVGRLPPNAWALWDLHGNVCEWCSDWFGPYPTGDVTDPTGAETGSEHSIRGGGWRHDALCCRSAFRFRIFPEYTSYSLGFRVALDLPD